MGHKLPLVLLAGLASAAPGSAATYEAEALKGVSRTSGETERQNLVELSLAQPGEFGADKVLHWHSAKGPGAVMTLKLPAQKPGRYRLVLHLARSGDYGIFQILVNGKPAGRPVDLHSTSEELRVFSLKVDLGDHALSNRPCALAFRVMGSDPSVKPPIYGLGIDRIEIKRAQPPSPGR